MLTGGHPQAAPQQEMDVVVGVERALPADPRLHWMQCLAPKPGHANPSRSNSDSGENTAVDLQPPARLCQTRFVHSQQHYIFVTSGALQNAGIIQR